VWQGDPLSPFLFVLTMEALNCIFRLADVHGLLKPLQPTSIKFRLSLYADDLVIFLSPIAQDLMSVRTIMDTFAGASGLQTNIGKCQFTPICCIEEQVAQVQELLSCKLVHFPCRYLGVPLSVYALKKSGMQPLVDTVADRLPTWKARLMS
jgi:hypothetical protein